MKKLMLICLAIFFIFALAACDSEPDDLEESQLGIGEYSDIFDVSEDEIDEDFYDEEPDWQGVFASDGFSVTFTDFDGETLKFAFSNLRNGEYFFSGTAEIDSDDSFAAEFDRITFYLSWDSKSVDFVANMDSEWEHLSGEYLRID